MTDDTPLRALFAEQRDQFSKLCDQLRADFDARTGRWLSVSQAARYSQLGERTVRRMLASGRLTRHQPTRGRVVIDKLELDTLIESAVDTPAKRRGLKAV